MPIIPAAKGYQNFGILCGFEFENIPCSLLFGFTYTPPPPIMSKVVLTDSKTYRVR